MVLYGIWYMAYHISYFTYCFIISSLLAYLLKHSFLIDTDLCPQDNLAQINTFIG